MGRYDWNRLAHKRRYKWQRYDRSGDSQSRDYDDDDHDDDDDDYDDRRPKGYRGDNLMKHATSGGMLGSLGFWFIIWMFTGFSEAVVWIFLGIALLQGFGWEELFGKKKRKKKRASSDYRDDNPTLKNAPPQTAPVEAQGDSTNPTAPALDPAIHARLIRESSAQRAQLRAAAAAADGDLGTNLRRMDAATTKVVESLEKDPSNLAHVQRMFTYYLPSATELLKARSAVAGTGNTTHQAEIDGMFGRLATAFEDFVARINGTDIRSLEIDLKLLEQSLDAEFAPEKNR